MVIDYRLAATFTHRHHIMQTERYNFFVAVAFTLKITLTDRAHMSHQTLIRVLRPLRMRAPSLQHPKRTISFPRGNLIQAHGGSSVRPETRTHSELWCESGPVPFGVLPECTAAPARCFSTSPSQLALPGESCPLSDWSLLQHSHLLTDMPFSKAYPKVMNPMEIRPLIVGSLMGPSSSPSFRQGPGGHIPFSKLPAIELYRDGLLAQSRNSSLRAVTCLSRSSPVCPGCHQSFPVVTRSIPECQMANASVKYLETPTTERTDRESSEECPRHRTFRPKLLTFSGGGPHIWATNL